MNRPLLRGVLNALAIELIATWAIVAFAGYRWGYLLVAASCLFLMTGYMWLSDQMRLDAEFRRAYDDAHRLLCTEDCDTIYDQAYDDILRRDPLAYPLTKRATWPADEWSGQ